MSKTFYLNKLNAARRGPTQSRSRHVNFYEIFNFFFTLTSLDIMLVLRFISYSLIFVLNRLFDGIGAWAPKIHILMFRIDSISTDFRALLRLLIFGSFVDV